MQPGSITHPGPRAAQLDEATQLYQRPDGRFRVCLLPIHPLEAIAVIECIQVDDVTRGIIDIDLAIVALAYGPFEDTTIIDGDGVLAVWEVFRYELGVTICHILLARFEFAVLRGDGSPVGEGEDCEEEEGAEEVHAGSVVLVGFQTWERGLLKLMIV